jgi:hypothetical protein
VEHLTKDWGLNRFSKKTKMNLLFSYPSSIRISMLASREEKNSWPLFIGSNDGKKVKLNKMVVIGLKHKSWQIRKNAFSRNQKSKKFKNDNFFSNEILEEFCGKTQVSWTWFFDPSLGILWMPFLKVEVEDESFNGLRKTVVYTIRFRKLRSRGRCYDHNIMRFFSKTKVMIILCII